MLDKFRQSARGITGIALIAILVLAFIMWGIADSFTGFSNTQIARVGDIIIERDEFQIRYRQHVEFLQNQFNQPLTAERLRALQAQNNVLQSRMNMAALSHAAHDMGLAYADNHIAQSIIDDPNFHDAFGKFDEPKFRDILRRNGLSEEMFVKDQREFSLRRQFLEATIESASAPAPLLQRLYEHYLETRSAHYIIISLDSVGETGTASEEELRQFYERTRLRFADPERRSATLLSISHDRFAELVDIDEADIKAEYDYNLAYYTNPEKRAVDQLILSTDEDIQKAQDMRAQAYSFVEIVTALGQTLDDTDLGVLTQNEFISTELADIAFSLAEGEMSEPTESPIGMVIVRVRKVEPSVVTPYAEVYEDIRNNLVYERASDDLIRFSEIIIDDLAGGADLEDVAQKFDLKLDKISAININGEDKNGELNPLIQKLPKLADNLFDAETNITLPLEETENGILYWARLDEIIPQAARPFEDIRELVAQHWEREEQKKMLESLATHLADVGNKSGHFDGIRNTLTRDVLTTKPMIRQTTNETFSQAALNKLFAARKGEFVWAPVGFGDSLILMQVADIIAPAQDDAYALNLLRDGETRKLRSDMASLLVNGLLQDYGAEIYEDNLAFALRMMGL